MEIVSDLTARANARDLPLLGRRHGVALGVFDGVHVGHQAIIEEAGRVADHASAALAVVTFDPHPAVVLRPDLAPKTLTGLDHKMELLADLGVDTVVVVNFDEARAAEDAADFVSSVLVEALAATHVVVGCDFHFGRDRKGDVALLESLGVEHNFVALGQPLSVHNDLASDATANSPITSTSIRAAVAEGQVELAKALLGRPHQVRGTVVQGDQRGRTIGFPTANIAVPGNVAVPGDGVYAGWWVTGSAAEAVPDRWPCAVNVGKRPTFYQDVEHSIIEAHLIDWHGDLYGVEGGIEFEAGLRSEKKFDGLEALKAQLTADVIAARNHLNA